MADHSYVENQLTAVPDQRTANVLKSVFRYVLTQLALGRATAGQDQSAASTAAPSKNLSGGFIKGTTPASANQEFAIAHGFGHAPYLAFVVIPLDQVNAGVPRLVNSRAADSTNLYLKSNDTNQAFYLYVEG